MIVRQQSRHNVSGLSFALPRCRLPRIRYALTFSGFAAFTVYYICALRLVAVRNVRYDIIVLTNNTAVTSSQRYWKQPIGGFEQLASNQSSNSILSLEGKLLFQPKVLNPQQPESSSEVTANQSVLVSISKYLTTNYPEITAEKLGGASASIAINTKLRKDYLTTSLPVTTKKTPLNLVRSCNIKRPVVPDELVRRHKIWQVENQGGYYEMVLFSAYYDDRPQEGPMPWIRVQSVIRLPPKNRTDPTVYCQLWFSDGIDRPYIVQAANVTTGQDWAVENNKVYGQRMYSCKVPHKGQPVPSQVSLVLGDEQKGCRKATNLLPVQQPLENNVTEENSQTSGKFDHEFTICVHTSYGNYSREHLVEWFEANRMFGISRFNIYNATLDKHLDPVFKYYSSRDRHGNYLPPEPQPTSSYSNQYYGSEMLEVNNNKALLVFRQHQPAVDDYTKPGLKLGSPLAYNDCMMNNMKSSRWILPIDYDEIIVPRSELRNYHTMLQEIDKHGKLNTSHHSYSFRCSYFFRNFQQDDSQPQNLMTMRFRRRLTPLGFLWGAKTFVDPRRCKVVFNHYCLTWFTPNPEKKTLPLDVPAKFGLLHHYRQRCDGSVCNQINMTAQHVDDTMLGFKEELSTRVDRVLNEIHSMSLIGLR